MSHGQGCSLDNDGPEDFPQKTFTKEFLSGRPWVQRFALRRYDRKTSSVMS